LIITIFKDVPILQESKDGVASHKAIRSQFVGLLIARRKLYPARLADILPELLNERTIADYRTIQVSQKKAKYLCEKATDFVNTIVAKLGG